MIRVLVMANESVLADYIVSILAKEADLEVFRVSRDELGSRRDFSIVIVVDDEMDEYDNIKLKEIFRDDTALLLIRVSVKSRNVYVDESYELVNPGISQMVELLREFKRKNRAGKSGDDSNMQKKMIRIRIAEATKYNRQQVGSSQRETSVYFYSFFIQYLRLQNPGNVTLPAWQEYSTGHST